MNHTATLVDIRGLYTRSSVASNISPLIPKQFFQTYKTSMFDTAHAHRIEVFRSLHPEFDFYFYDDDAMNDFMQTHCRITLFSKFTKAPNLVLLKQTFGVTVFCIPRAAFTSTSTRKFNSI